MARVLLDALTPEQVALALASAGEVASRHQRISRAAELAVERARYEADRAERAFSAVEPENRLVARTLEARWEAKLAAVAEAGQALEAARDALPPLPSRAELEKIAADLPALWHAPATSARDRKRLLRTLIADVTLLPEPDPGMVWIGIRWHTGATDELRVGRPAHRGTARRSPSPAVEMVRQLGPVTPAAELAGAAERRRADHRERPPVRRQGRPVDPPRLPHPAPAPDADGEISAAEAASQLGCSAGNDLRLDPGRAARRAARPGKPARGSPGTTAPRWPAATASPHPGTSTPRPAAPGPAAALNPARNVTTACHAHASRSSDLA